MGDDMHTRPRVLTNAIQITNRILTELGTRKLNTIIGRYYERPRTIRQFQHPIYHRGGQLAKRIHCLVQMERINPRQQMSLNKMSSIKKFPQRQIALEATNGS